MKTPKIDRRDLPTRFPVLATVVLWLLLDRLSPPGWVLGAAWTLWGIWWAVALYTAGQEETRRVFPEAEADQPPPVPPSRPSPSGGSIRLN